MAGNSTDRRPGDGVRRQYRQPRLAEMIAGELRERILSGDLADGSLLPKQEDLLEEFNVSGPSIREALRILETEGLVTVRRGNVGGAVVHFPEAASVAYVVSLVLQSKEVGLKDVALAIQEIEPTCVALCAARPDRVQTVVPNLRRISSLGEEAVDDTDESMRLTRDFHRALVEGCGNETLILIVGALETLWAAHIQEWAKTRGGARRAEPPHAPDRERRPREARRPHRARSRRGRPPLRRAAPAAVGPQRRRRAGRPGAGRSDPAVLIEPS